MLGSISAALVKFFAELFKLFSATGKGKDDVRAGLAFGCYQKTSSVICPCLRQIFSAGLFSVKFLTLRWPFWRRQNFIEKTKQFTTLRGSRQENNAVACPLLSAPADMWQPVSNEKGELNLWH